MTKKQFISAVGVQYCHYSGHTRTMYVKGFNLESLFGAPVKSYKHALNTQFEIVEL